MITPLRIRLAAAVAALAFAITAGPAAARSSYVQDGASLFTTDTVASLNSKIGALNAQTRKEIVVVSVPSLNGATPQDAAERVFAEQQVNGILIYMAKSEKQLGIIPDRASSQFFPKSSLDAIRAAMRGYFRAGDFDSGIKVGVDLVITEYRSHAGSLGARTSYAPATQTSNGIFGMSFIFLLLVLVVGFLIIRAIFRAVAGPRVYPPGYGQGMGMGPGYGPGYGGGFGGGGSFFSGLLGGLGGAWLGNELFGRHDGGGYVGSSGFDGGSNDGGGWQSDPGQADMGNSSFGDWGGGGGGDSGGGGGDSGGGW
jgi:uncharacterized protein